MPSLGPIKPGVESLLFAFFRVGPWNPAVRPASCVAYQQSGKAHSLCSRGAHWVLPSTSVIWVRQERSGPPGQCPTWLGKLGTHSPHSWGTVLHNDIKLSLTDESSSLCLNCLRKQCGLWFWESGILVCARQRVPTWPAPSINRGHWISNAFPWAETSHVCCSIFIVGVQGSSVWSLMRKTA